METEKQHKKQYDWLKGYQFVKGQSGNPGGRKKGTKTLKAFAREYLESLPDEEKVEFLSHLPEELVFRMAEGNPAQEQQLSGNITVELADLYGERKDSLPPEPESSNG